MDVLNAVNPLNELLFALHGPVENVGRTMSRLVPFPSEVPSLPDGELLDLNVMVAAGAAGDRSRSSVEARARYATSERVSQIRDFYVEQLELTGARLIHSRAAGNPTNAAVRAVLNDAFETSYMVTIDELRGYRAVILTVRYGDFDAREMFDTFAGWHNGVAPVEERSEPTGVEVSTFANGRIPAAMVLYSTYYECSHTPRTARRALVDKRVGELGWTYREPREGIMFMQDGQFDAETHVMGDDTSSNVTFVGEFLLGDRQRVH